MCKVSEGWDRRTGGWSGTRAGSRKASDALKVTGMRKLARRLGNPSGCPVVSI